MRQNVFVSIIVVIASGLLGGCCDYSKVYTADQTLASAKAALRSSTEGEAYLGGSISRFQLSPPVQCSLRPAILMAPVARPDQGNVVHYGAFAVRHGEHHRRVTLFWWNLKGELRNYSVTSACNDALELRWVNERTMRIRDGRSYHVIRLNEDDGQPVTEF
jgi:hypothetical protein